MWLLILFLVVWGVLGVLGRQSLQRKGYDFGGIDDIRNMQRADGAPLLRQGENASGIVVLGGLFTLLAWLLLPEKKRHYSGDWSS